MGITSVGSRADFFVATEEEEDPCMIANKILLEFPAFSLIWRQKIFYIDTMTAAIDQYEPEKDWRLLPLLLLLLFNGGLRDPE